MKSIENHFVQYRCICIAFYSNRNGCEWILSDIVNVPDIKTVSRNAEKEYSGASLPSILLIPIFRLPVAVS